MKNRRALLLLPLVVLLVLAVGLLLPRVLAGSRVIMLLDRAWEQESRSALVRVETGSFSAEAILSWWEIRGERYYAADFGDERVYLHNEVLCFPGGSRYDLAQWMDEAGIPEGLDPKLLLLAGFEKTAHMGNPAWEFAPDAEPGLLLKALYPQMESHWKHLNSLKVFLREDSGRLADVMVYHQDFDLTIHFLPDPPEPIPTEDLMQMSAALSTDIRTLMPFFDAMAELLTAGGSIRGELSLQVDCGPLPIRDTAQVCLTQKGLYLDRGGETIDLSGGQAADSASVLFGLGWLMCREGTWVPGGENSGTFSLPIGQEDLKAGLFSILPELEGLEFRLEDGQLDLIVTDGSLHDAELTCAGEMPFLITTIPLSIQLDLTIP